MKLNELRTIIRKMIKEELENVNKEASKEDILNKPRPTFPLPPLERSPHSKKEKLSTSSIYDWHPEYYPKDYRELPSDLQRGMIDMAKKAGVTKLTPNKVQKFYSRSLENNYDQLQASSKKQALVLLKQFIAGAEEGYRK
jgi:hypothetical protein